MLPFSQTLPQCCPGPNPNHDVDPGTLDTPMGQAESVVEGVPNWGPAILLPQAHISVWYQIMTSSDLRP